MQFWKLKASSGLLGSTSVRNRCVESKKPGRADYHMVDADKSVEVNTLDGKTDKFAGGRE